MCLKKPNIFVNNISKTFNFAGSNFLNFVIFIKEKLMKFLVFISIAVLFQFNYLFSQYFHFQIADIIAGLIAGLIAGIIADIIAGLIAGLIARIIAGIIAGSAYNVSCWFEHRQVIACCCGLS